MREKSKVQSANLSSVAHCFRFRQVVDVISRRRRDLPSTCGYPTQVEAGDLCIYIKVGFVYIYLYFIFISILHVNKNTAASVDTGGGINWIARASNIADGHKVRGEGAKRRTTINCRFVLVHDTSNNYKSSNETRGKTIRKQTQSPKNEE